MLNIFKKEDKDCKILKLEEELEYERKRNLALKQENEDLTLKLYDRPERYCPDIFDYRMEKEIDELIAKDQDILISHYKQVKHEHRELSQVHRKISNELCELRKDYGQMEMNYKLLKTKNAELEKGNNKLGLMSANRRISELSAKLSTTQRKLNTVEHSLNRRDREYDQLREQYDKLKTANEQLRREYNGVEDLNEILANKCEQLECKLNLNFRVEQPCNQRVKCLEKQLQQSKNGEKSWFNYFEDEYNYNLKLNKEIEELREKHKKLDKLLVDTIAERDNYLFILRANGVI